MYLIVNEEFVGEMFNKPKSIFFHIIGFNYCFLTQIILFNITHEFAHR